MSLDWLVVTKAVNAKASHYLRDVPLKIVQSGALGQLGHPTSS